MKNGNAVYDNAAFELETKSLKMENKKDKKGSVNSTAPVILDDEDNPVNRKKSVWNEIFPVSAKKIATSSDLVPVHYYQLFRYATGLEIMAIIIGIILALLLSLSFPIMTILYGEYTSLLTDRSSKDKPCTNKITSTWLLNWFGGGRKLEDSCPSQEDVNDAILEDSKAFGLSMLVLSVMMFLLGSAAVYILNRTALRQIGRIRGKFFISIMRQDISWYDTNTNMNFATKITEDLNKMKEGMGEKIVMFIYLFGAFIFSITLSFIYGWELTLVTLSCAPIIIIATAVVTKMQSSLTVKELETYGVAGRVAEEVFQSIRTVFAFSGEQKEADRFSKLLVPATKQGQKKGLYSGIGTGVMWFVIYCSYAVAFWYGIELILRDKDVEDPDYNTAVLMIVFFGVLSGAQSLGMTSPHIEAFSTARASAAMVYSIIDRVPPLDSFSPHGIQPEGVTGNIVFKGLHFHYPSRPDVKILRGFDLEIKAGETIAFVGASGCGKSTLLQLMQRLYDPIQGSIYLDGNEIRTINVKWLRSHMGVVGQEPFLFNTTIETNIRYGRQDATKEEVELAAKQANCHDFIRKLPDGYDTEISNAQLSGGQKQRIAIARALVRKPNILLLDEATSALDLQSEAKVQKTLDQASVGRTTLIVAHRLSTITNADRIVYINEGVVTEVGSHEELIARKGQYYNLVAAEAAMASLNASEQKTEKRLKLEKMQSFTESKHDTMSELSMDEDETEGLYPAPLTRIIKMNSPEKWLLIFGSVGSIMFGATFPAFAIVFGDIFKILGSDDADKVRESSHIYSILFVVIGVVTGVATFTQTWAFNVAGCRLTTRLREYTFSSMIRQEVAWFDDSKNSVGALCSRLSGDASAVQGATGTTVGAIVMAFATLILGLILGLSYSIKMGLVCFCIMPLILLSIYIEQRYTVASSMAEKKALEHATKIAVEAISNIRTVASLCQENTFYNRYQIQLDEVNKALTIKNALRGPVYAFGQAGPFLAYGMSLWYGGYLVATDGVPYDYIIKVSEALIFGAAMVGQALAFAPNFSSAKLSAGRIFRILDRVPNIISDPVAHANDNAEINGNISYRDIEFRYPTRPEVQVLRGLNLEIRAGQTVALVGFSGCGKSTVIQLLQRLYDPDSGMVRLDGLHIKSELTIPTLRKQLGIVSQEPVLFDRTIAENIAYGDNEREVPMTDIIDAAKQANIHKFVTSLPLGYNTRLGTRGTQLSGGQKQRIAIARALVRHPRILLLDEATSALDRQSEKVVQEALDKAQEGRTCITIAHRLVTIQNADLICVVDKGVIVEAGKHQELLRKGGFYYRLHNLAVEN